MGFGLDTVKLNLAVLYLTWDLVKNPAVGGSENKNPVKPSGSSAMQNTKQFAWLPSFYHSLSDDFHC